MTPDFTPDSPLTDYCAKIQAGRSKLIGASDASTCYRQQAYRYFETPKTDTSESWLADMGTLFHLGWGAVIAAQYRPEERTTAVRLELEELPRPIEADDVDYVNAVVYDVKTTSDRAWQAWLNAGSPYDDHWAQAKLYGLALHRMDGRAWTIGIIAFNRETGRHHIYERPLDVSEAESLARELKARDWTLFMASEVAADGSPEDFPREGAGPGRGYPCDWCEWVSACWPDVPPGDKRTPQSMTIDPEDVLAVEALAAEYLDASAEATAAEKRRKDAAVFLRGLSGEFGAFKVSTVGGRPKDPVVDTDAAVTMLSDLVGQGGLPMKPGGFTATSVRIARLSKAPGKGDES